MATSLTVEAQALEGGAPVREARVVIIVPGHDTLLQTVDSLGRARFHNLPAGRVQLAVRRLGYAFARGEVELRSGCQAEAVVRLAAWSCDIAPGCVQPASRMDVRACRPDV